MAGLLTRLVGAPDGPLVVLLHGVTASGEQMRPLAGALVAALPHLRCAIPEGPEVLEGFAGGRSWWPVPIGHLMRLRARGLPQDLTGQRPEGMTATRQRLARLVDELAGERPFALVGFSQGAMLATEYLLKEPRRPAAVALLAGTIVGEADWRAHLSAAAGVPVLMTHRTGDPVLLPATAARLRDQLRAAGARVTWIEHPGGHELPPDDDVVAFLRALWPA